MAGKPDTAARAFGYLAGGAGLSVVLIYLAVNVSAIRAFRTGFRDDFRFCRYPPSARCCSSRPTRSGRC
jgi:hypothetical protein